jgi:membrane protein implicated in regulation of membrane protease activity
MEPWVLWLIVAAIFGVGEILSLGLFLAPFAGGALVAALVAAVGGPAVAVWAVFLVVSLVLPAALRPLARSHRRMPAQIRTGTAALVGSSAMVVERISNDEAVGTVRLGGELWTARAFDEDQVFEPGARVQVIDIKGATALVSD